MRLLLCNLLWSVLLSVSTPAWADSVILGTVVNAETHQLVPEVVITATSPAHPREEIVRSDAEGSYRIPWLTPGLYTLRFEKKGFQSLMRQEVRLRLDRTLRVNVELLPEGFIKQPPVVLPPPAEERPINFHLQYFYRPSFPSWTMPYVLIPPFRGMNRLCYSDNRADTCR